MMRTIVGVVLVLAVASTGAAQSDCLFKEYDIKDLASILEREGYSSIEVVNEGNVHFEVEGAKYVLSLMNDGDLRMFWGIGGARLAFEDINEWNRDTRITKAFIDADGDPVVTSDLLATAGINEEIFKNFVGYFVHNFGPKFQKFVEERNRAR